MSAHTDGGSPEQPASSPVNTVHGYLAGVGAGAALLAAAVLAFMALVGMVSFNLWPQGTPRASAGAAELSAPAQAGAEFTSATLAATLLVSVGPLGESPAPPRSDPPNSPDPADTAPAPPVPGEDAATGEDEGGRISGEGDPDHGGEVSGGAPQGWTQGSGNGHGGKARGSGGHGKPSSGPSRQGKGTRSGRQARGRRDRSRTLPVGGFPQASAKAPSSRGAGKGRRR